MHVRTLLPFALVLPLVAQQQPQPEGRPADAVLQRVRQGGSLCDVEYRRGDDGMLHVAGSEPGAGLGAPLLGEGMADGLRNAGAIGYLALFVHGRGDLLGMTDAEHHLGWLGVDTSDPGLRQFLATPVPEATGATARAQLFDRMLAVDLLQRRGTPGAVVELELLAERDTTPAPLRERAAAALAALRGEPLPLVRQLLDPATLPLPPAFDACVVIDHARLPDLGWLTGLGRRLGMLVTAQTVVMGGGEVDTMIWQGAQRMADLCAELPFGVALHFGNARIDHSCATVTMKATPQPSFAVSFAAAGAFDAERWRQAELAPALAAEAGAAGATLELTDGLALAGIDTGKGIPRPARARELLADTGASIRILAPGTSKLWPSLRFLDAPTAIEGELRITFGDPARIEVRVTGRDEDAAAEWLELGKEQLTRARERLPKDLPPIVPYDDSMQLLLDALFAAELRTEDATAIATVTVRGFDRHRFAALAEHMVQLER